MDRAGSGKAILKSGKKKPGKVEIDRQKQAERKRRRLEKALATSAAIRSELEKKKQKKMEEQQRLDKEGLAIAEAVALHVLIGEDNEETHNFMPNQKRRLYPCDSSGHVGLFMGHPNFPWSMNEYSKQGCDWNEASTNDVHVEDMHSQFYKEMCGLMAAEAVASLQIGEKPHKVQLSGNQGNFYKEY